MMEEFCVSLSRGEWSGAILHQSAKRVLEGGFLTISAKSNPLPTIQPIGPRFFLRKNEKKIRSNGWRAICSNNSRPRTIMGCEGGPPRPRPGRNHPGAASERLCGECGRIRLVFIALSSPSHRAANVPRNALPIPPTVKQFPTQSSHAELIEMRDRNHFRQ